MLNKLGNARNGVVCVYLAGVVDEIDDDDHEERVHAHEQGLAGLFVTGLAGVAACGSSDAKDL